jgi:putative membrane protein
MNKKIFTTALAATAMLSVVPAFAQQNVRFSYDGRPERMFRTVKGLNMHDSMGIKDAAVSNMLEIKTSELALNRGQSTWVRQYAKEMIADHKAAHEELRLIANRKGVDLPGALPASKQKMVNQLARLRGAAFDRKYREIQLMGHRETSAKFQEHIRGGRDEDVKSYLVKTLPAVKMHYRMAQIRRTMTGPTKMEHNG